jgi:hypothetical protein
LIIACKGTADRANTAVGQAGAYSADAWRPASNWRYCGS